MNCEKARKCSIESIVDIVGSTWNLFIIWHLRTKKLRFTELQNRICGINSKTITRHLRDLERFAILEAMLAWGGAYPNIGQEDGPCTGPAKETVCEQPRPSETARITP